MGLFGTKKKKTENVKTLTETEIQQRLYGHLRVPSTAVEDSASETTSRQASFVIRRPGESSQSQAESLKTQEALGSHKTTSSGLVSAPQGRKGSLNEKPKTEKRKGPSFLSLFAAFALVIRNVLFFLLTAIFKLIEAIFRFFLSIDFRKPLVKRMATGMGVVAFIGLLFLSTHFLNVKRETAMKSPHRRSLPEVETEVSLPGALAEKSTENIKATGPSIPALETKPPVEDQKPEASGLKPAEQGAYSIQIATFAALEDATRLVSKLDEQDVGAFTKSLERPGGKTYYCVFVGHFKNYREAEENLARFKKKSLAKPFQDAFIRALKTE